MSDVKARIEANRPRRNTRSTSFTRHHSPANESHPSYHYSTPSSVTPSSSASSAAASFYQNLFDMPGPIEKEMNLVPDEFSVGAPPVSQTTRTQNNETIHSITRHFWNKRETTPDEVDQEQHFPLRPRRATVSMSTAEAARHRKHLPERRPSKSETSQEPASGRTRRPRSGTTSLIPTTPKQISVPLSALQFAARKKDNAHSIWSSPQEDEQEADEINRPSTRIQDLLQQREERTRMRRPSMQEKQDRLFNDDLVYQLRHVFKDILDLSVRDGDLANVLRARFEMQEKGIHRLECALREKEDQICLLEARQASPCGKLADVLEEEEEEEVEDEEVVVDEEGEEHASEEKDEEHEEEAEEAYVESMRVDELLKRCPDAMATFRQQIESEVYSVLFQEFESQKQILVAQQQESFEALRLKYRMGFERIVERLQQDPSRIHSERAKRVQKDPEERERYWKAQVEESQKSLQHLGRPK
ncbi:hypothetical protein DFQ30_010454 [Apophysomyces sp. BC1015]|nr:hypothetical protein DFQ30_010454 [Apophysomyces sp. BC1015]